MGGDRTAQEGVVYTWLQPHVVVTTLLRLQVYAPYPAPPKMSCGQHEGTGNVVGLVEVTGLVEVSNRPTAAH